MARRIPADKIKNRKHPHSWHKENCRCKGKEQAVRPQLAARQALYDGTFAKTTTPGFKRPGSQNRKKR